MQTTAAWIRGCCAGCSRSSVTTPASSTRWPARGGSHGDLWLFNLLIERKQDGARIVGVLDADRGSWGDPLADWTFFLLPRRASPQEQALFWQAYGQPGAGPGTLFRAQVYQGLHQGKILSVARRDGNERALKRAYRALADVVNTLQFELTPLFPSLWDAGCTSGGSTPGAPGTGAGSR
jgi:Phosphotransferase enzyme family